MLSSKISRYNEVVNDTHLKPINVFFIITLHIKWFNFLNFLGCYHDLGETYYNVGLYKLNS